MDVNNEDTPVNGTACCDDAPFDVPMAVDVDDDEEEEDEEDADDDDDDEVDADDDDDDNDGDDSDSANLVLERVTGPADTPSGGFFGGRPRFLPPDVDTTDDGNEELSHIIYNFECRQYESRYVGRTLQHLEARIHQHVPLHVMPVEARSSRPRRERPPKNGTETGGAPSLGTEPTGLSLSSSSSSACSSLPSSVPPLPSIPSSSLVSSVSSSLTSSLPSSVVSTSGGRKRVSKILRDE